MLIIHIFLIVFCGVNTLMGMFYFFNPTREYGRVVMHFSLGALVLYLGVSGLNI